MRHGSRSMPSIRLETKLEERLGGRKDELDLRDLGCHAQNIDVTLGELAKAPLLRPLGPPYRPDLDRFERIGERRPVVRVVARERHGEVEAQPEIGEILLSMGGDRVTLRASLESCRSASRFRRRRCPGEAGGPRAPGVSIRRKPYRLYVARIVADA